MTTTEFANLLGVTHPAILNWEKGKARPSISMDIFIRLLMADQLKQNNKVFRETFKFARTLVRGSFEAQSEPIEINAEKQLIA